MRKVLSICICALLILFSIVPVSAQAEESRIVRYAGIATQDLTVRATKSQSGKRLERIKKGEIVQIISLEKDWFLVQKGDAEGYVVGALVDELEALDPEIPVPFIYNLPTVKKFKAVYSGKANKQISLRAVPEKDGKLLATIYENERLDLQGLGEEWTIARKGKKVGFVLTEFLKDLEVLNPYQALDDGKKAYPYAATVVRPMQAMGTVLGQTGILQTLPVGAVIAVGEPNENGDVLFPYKRTVGKLDGTALDLTPVVPVDEAQPGDLIAVFSTFFVPDGDDEIIAGRLHNIEQGVRLFDGMLLESNELFSFNKIAAPYTRSNGYMLGPIINYVSDKQTGYGGGICQVSTTIYNVLLQLPMDIKRWQPHSSYGIDYAPVEYDAAVGKGNIDLRFESSLPYRVQMKLDVCDGVVTVRFYREGMSGQNITSTETEG